MLSWFSPFILMCWRLPQDVLDCAETVNEPAKRRSKSAASAVLSPPPLLTSKIIIDDQEKLPIKYHYKKHCRHHLSLERRQQQVVVDGATAKRPSPNVVETFAIDEPDFGFGFGVPPMLNTLSFIPEIIDQHYGEKIYCENSAFANLKILAILRDFPEKKVRVVTFYLIIL